MRTVFWNETLNPFGYESVHLSNCKALRKFKLRKCLHIYDVFILAQIEVLTDKYY